MLLDWTSFWTSQFRNRGLEQQLYQQFLESLEHQLERIIQFVRTQAETQKAPATSTNYSLRLTLVDGSQFQLITRSGFPKNLMTKQDFLIFDQEGTLLWKHDPSFKPSAESAIHQFLYQQQDPALRPSCVLHFHSLLSTFLSALYVREGRDHIPFAGYELLKAFKGQTTHDTEILLPIVPNHQDMNQLTSDMSSQPLWEKQYGLLIAGHGLYTWGDTVEEAIRHAEAWEYLLELKHLEHLYGERPLYANNTHHTSFTKPQSSISN
jgi:methylthioribulose-1-phosphate dehydratase